MKFSLLTILYLQAHTTVILEQQSKLQDNHQTKQSGNLRFELVQAKSNQIEQYTTLQHRTLSNNNFCRVGDNCYQGQCVNNACICFVYYSGVQCEYYQIRSNSRPTDDDNEKRASMGDWFTGVTIAGGFILTFLFGWWCRRCNQNHNNAQAPVATDEPEIFNNPVLARQAALKRYQSQNNLSSLEQENLQPSQANAPDLQQQPINIRNCSICLDNIYILLEYELNCPSKHIFHKKCINLWLMQNKTCPQCRAEII